MSSGIHWSEWIFPIVGAHHAAYNAAANAAGEPDFKVTTPDSKQARANADQEERETLAEESRRTLGEQAAKQAAEEEERQTALQPDRVRTRARAAAALLGQSGRRPRASTYLAGG